MYGLRWRRRVSIRTPAVRQSAEMAQPDAAESIHYIATMVSIEAKVDATDACAYVETLILGEGLVLEPGDGSVKLRCENGMGSLTL